MTTVVNQLEGTTFFDGLQKLVKPEWVAMLRHHMGDYAERNPLLGGKQEFTDEDMKMAILSALSYMDSAPPSSVRIAMQGSQIPVDMFLEGGAIQLQKMALHRKQRNALNYSDGGVSIDTDRFDKYERVLGRMQQAHDRQLREYKKTINARQARGAVASGYFLLYVML